MTYAIKLEAILKPQALQRHYVFRAVHDSGFTVFVDFDWYFDYKLPLNRQPLPEKLDLQLAFPLYCCGGEHGVYEEEYESYRQVCPRCDSPAEAVSEPKFTWAAWIDESFMHGADPTSVLHSWTAAQAIEPLTAVLAVVELTSSLPTAVLGAIGKRLKLAQAQAVQQGFPGMEL